MCGITGWFDVSRELGPERETIAAMTASMTNRGPDDGGMWIKGPIALGHRRLAVIDLDRGRQPMHLEEDGHDYAVTFSGEIYNYRELRSLLGTRGHTFRTSSDTEVLLHSYLEWGEECVTRLNGMFAFAIWDGRRHQLMLARDRVGIKPLYYARLPAGIVFGSEPKAILTSGQISPRVTRKGLREIFDMVKTPGEAIFEDIQELRPGHLMVVSANQIRQHRYWRLEAREHNDDYETTTQQVRELLATIVREQLVSDVPLCTLLSGGLDSSAITSIAAPIRHPDPLKSFSVDFHNADGDGFTRDAVRSSTDAPHARALAKYAETDHHEIILNSGDLLAPDIRSAILRATDLPPAYWGDMWPSLYLLFREIKKHSTVAISGEGADELFGGYLWFFNPAAVNGRTFPWLTGGSSRYFGGLELFDKGFVASLELEEARNQSYLDALSEVPRLETDDPVNASMRTVTHLNLTRFMQTLLDRKDRMSMAVGLEVRVPYCDHRLIEYVFNVPWEMKTRGGAEKTLLRDAVRDLVPESILNRKKNPYPATQSASYESGLIDRVEQLVNDGSSPISPFLDRDKVKRRLKRERDEISLPYTRGSIELCLWLNSWLEEYSVSLDL